jgi:hypothetical protein
VQNRLGQSNFQQDRLACWITAKPPWRLGAGSQDWSRF